MEKEDGRWKGKIPRARRRELHVLRADEEMDGWMGCREHSNISEVDGVNAPEMSLVPGDHYPFSLL